MSVSLSELQREFLSSLSTGKDPSTLDPFSRFSVYSRAYELRIKESLEEDFPETLSNIKNKSAFIDDYMIQYPSSFWTLGEYGKFFPTFVSKSFPDDHELGFLASLEWARWVAHSIGAPEIPYAANTEREITIVINPSLQIVQGHERNVFVFFAGDELRETDVSTEDVRLVEESLAGVLVSHLNISEDGLIKFVTKWSSQGVIIGFKEIS
jgi:hypothetical protein